VKYAVVTFGCRVNQADSLGFEEALQERGGCAVPAETADLVVVNSCSVTCSADQGTRQTIRRIARANPDARIVVTGCYATRQPFEVTALPNVVRVIRNPDKERFGQVVDDLGWTTADRFGGGGGSCGSPIEPGIAGRTAYTLRVQTGCAQSCSYCIIPVTRGAPRSVAPSTVLREIERVSSAGFKEIAITGVHLGSYGRDLTPASSLFDLLEHISRADVRDVRFRISSLEPMDCSADVVDLLATEPRFAHHVHLPLQHASDRLLAVMSRPYTLDQYAELVGRVRSRMPDASIGTDLIVGFPGETDADFRVLASYIEQSPITHAHVFPYSDRPGTAATMMTAKVDGRATRDRARVLRDISSSLATRFRSAQVHSVHSALTIDDGSVAVTGNYLKVRIPAGRARNEWVRVRVTTGGDPPSGEVV
jgi:threonylcarbamoyladenosine tRNA methylthiotransferase MtaB